MWEVFGWCMVVDGVATQWWMVVAMVASVVAAMQGREEEEEDGLVWRKAGRLALPLLAQFTWMKIIQVNLAEILAPKISC